jgi:hypothetical protein
MENNLYRIEIKESFTSYSTFYAVASDSAEALTNLKEWLHNKYSWTQDVTMNSIHLLAEEANYPKCKGLLIMPVEPEADLDILDLILTCDTERLDKLTAKIEDSDLISDKIKATFLDLVKQQKEWQEDMKKKVDKAIDEGMWIDLEEAGIIIDE